ncbi:MAG: hypothetical protein AAF798_03615 [Bacteroidota bacterium]
MDNLEQHIRNNRAQLDQIEAFDEGAIWAGLQQELTQQKQARSGWQLQIGRNWQWSIAASIALLAAAWLFWPQPTHQAAQGNIAQYFPELAAQEQAYQQLIAQKEVELKIEQLSPIQFGDLLDELQLLDDLHEDHLADISKFGENQRLMQALIKYYEHKIRILEHISKEIEKQKNHDKLNHEVSI